MKRALAWMLALTFLVGGAAACSDDGDDKADDKTEESGDSGDSGDEGGDSGGGNSAITEYCDSVEELITKSEELAGDPTNADLTAEIQALTTEVTEKATALATEAASFDADDQAAYEECQAQFTDMAAG